MVRSSIQLVALTVFAALIAAPLARGRRSAHVAAAGRYLDPGQEGQAVKSRRHHVNGGLPDRL
jgi:hypothetical protein